MRVVWLVKEFGIGGAERLLLELAPHMPQVEYLPVAVVDRPRELVPFLEEAGMRARSLGAHGPFDPSWAIRLRRLVREIDPAVIHVQNPYPAAGARLALRGLRVPIVYTEHNVWESFHPATRWANKVTFSLNDAAIAVSNGVRASIDRSPVGRWAARDIETIHNGIDPEVVRRDADAATDVEVAPASYGTVTHLNASKAPENLIDAAVLLRGRGVGGDCYIVGDGPTRGALEARRREAQATHVHLLGERKDARAIMRRFSVFVIPSRFEGLPMVLLEALSLGLPIVTTAAGGIGEVITHEETGLIVPMGSPGALADAVQRVLEDGDLRAALASRGRELVDDRFHISRTATRLLAVYERVASS